MTDGLSLFVSRRSGRLARMRAFTLIELMMVVGIIAVLAGGLGLALRDSGSSSLVSAQAMLGTLVSQTRAQAAVNQTEARLLIYNTRGDSERYLRVLQVYVANPAGQTTTWRAVGSPVYLPRGIYIVPNNTNGLLAAGVTWPTNPAPVSSLTQNYSPNAATAPTGTPFASSATLFLQFGADGSVTPAPNPYLKLVVAAGVLSAGNLPSFTSANAVRGVLIRPNGAVSYANSATEF